MKRKSVSSPTIILFVALLFCVTLVLQAAERRIAVKDYVDKMKAGWIGQMAGVGLGAPTEFKYKGEIIPAEKMPQWNPGMVNQFGQDDIYVEMTFLRTLELYGFDCSIRQAGIDFANSGYQLWHANKAGRDNLRAGIAPPDSGHPQFNKHADDIDYQIEADFSGLIAPGMPSVVLELGGKFGRLMNYGDGLYGGQFVGAMYAEAFFEKDMEVIVRKGLECVPQGSQFHECITDVLKWHEENPGNWEKTWGKINEKYHLNPDYRKASCDKGAFNIDAKINAAYIVMGLLYGERDLDKTMVIATRCGQDSDCNPSNAAGILFTTTGFSNLPEKYKEALNPEGKFSHTPYNFPKLISVCESLSRQAVQRVGGRVEADGAGVETYIIPEKPIVLAPLEQCWTAGPVANSKFTEAEMQQIGEGKAEAKKDDWVALFDGKSMQGWKASENTGSWSVVDGTLCGKGGRSHLFYVGSLAPFQNFDFQAEVKTLPGSNSGIYFHTQFQEDNWPSKGIECQVNNSFTKDPRRTGSLYNIKNLMESAARDNEWWTQSISVRGRHVVVKINDKIVNDYTQPEGQEGAVLPGSGTFAFQQHDPGSVVFYRNVKVKRAE